MADDARTGYLDDRQSEAAASKPDVMSDEALLAKVRARLIASGKMTPEGQPVATEGEAGAAEGAAPAEPEPLAPEPLAPQTMPTSEDVKRSALRGPGKAAANLVDFGARGLDGALEFLGVDPETFSSGTAAGDAFDAAFGKPQTVAGQITQDVTGLVAPMQAIMRGAQYASKASYLTRAILGSAVTETALTSSKSTGLSNIGQSKPDDHWANNWATEMLAIENDDTAFTQFVKRTTENMIINGVAEGVAKVAGLGLGRLRGRKRDKTAISSTAGEQGLKPDANIDAIIDEGVAAKNELEALEALDPKAAAKPIAGAGVSVKETPPTAFQPEGGFSIDLAENRGGMTLDVNPAPVPGFALPPKAAVIAGVNLDESLKGQGNGVALYLEALRQAKARGLGLLSDGIVSDEARQVWAALKRRGIPVQDLPINPESSSTRFWVAPEDLAKLDVDAVAAAGRGPVAAPPTAPKMAEEAINPEAPVAPEAAPAAAPVAPARRPKELSGAKPRFNIGTTSYTPKFESDVDKAAYIAAQRTRSKADAKYVQWGMEATGMTEAEFRLHGAKVREHLKKFATGKPAGELKIPPMWAKAQRVGGEPVPTAPKAADAAVNPNTPDTNIVSLDAFRGKKLRAEIDKLSDEQLTAIEARVHEKVRGDSPESKDMPVDEQDRLMNLQEELDSVMLDRGLPSSFFPNRKPKVSPEAAPAETTAAPEAPAAVAPEAPVDATTAPVVDAAKKKVAAGKAAELDRTERLTRAFETSTSAPAVLKAQKESAIEAGHVFTPEQAARVDAAISARVVAATPEIPDRPFGAHLTITKTHLNGIRAAFLAGDFHGATGILGEIIGDTTNFNKIVESGDITDLLAALASEFSKDERSFRILAARSREATFATAEEELEALAKAYGSDANAVRLGLEKQLPGKDLTKTLTAYRMLEVSLASRANTLAIDVTTNGSKVAKTELARTLALTAIVNDRRAGLVSDIARALNSLQKMVDVPKGTVLRAAAAQVRMQGLDAFIDTVGGGDRNITRLAEMITSSEDPAMIAKLTAKASKMLSGTLGDAVYAFVIHNTLSGPLSAIKNVTSSAFYQGVWKTFSNLSGAAGRDAYSLLNGKDAYAFRKEWIRFQATRAAARKVFAQDSVIRRNIGEAWTTGQRVTTPGGAFMEHVGQTGKVTRLGEGNMARATELARTLRDGGQFKIPFGKRVNLGAAVFGQGRLNKMANALDASAQTRRLWSPLADSPEKEIAKRYGYAAKLIDYAGRVNSWPMHALATGDELNASIAKSAALEAETFEAVRALKLDPKASEAYIRDVIEHIEDIPMLQAKAAEGTLGAAGLQRLKIMEDVAMKSDDYVRQVTFTEAPGAATQVVAHARTAIPGARWMLFFVRTPGNIARAGVRESVPGRLGMAAGAMMDGRGADAAEQMGRAAFAGAVALGGWEMVTSGMMTGSGPSDPEANALWRDEGNTPYTFRLPTPAGPIAINYGSFMDPVAIPMQVMADLVEASEYMDDETHAAFAEEFTGRLMQLLESKSYLGSLVDTMDLISGRGSREKALIRVSKNFVPQSRLLATLRTNGLPVPAGVGQAMFGQPSPDDEIMSLQAFIDGRSTKGLIDRGRGVKLNEKGELVDIHGGVVDNPFVVHLVSEVAEDLPPGLAEGWLEFHAKVLGVRAQHGKFVQRDQLGEKRHLPVGYGPQNATGLLAHETDPVRDELIDVGMDKNVLATFGQFMGQELTPEQQDFYQRRYRRPTKDDATAHEMFAKVIASKEYQDLGQTVGSIKGGRAKILERHHKARMTMAQAHLRKKFPELDAVFINSMKQRAQMMSKDGSDAFAAERAARAPALIRAFKEAVDGRN